MPASERGASAIWTIYVASCASFSRRCPTPGSSAGRRVSCSSQWPAGSRVGGARTRRAAQDRRRGPNGQAAACRVGPGLFGVLRCSGSGLTPAVDRWPWSRVMRPGAPRDPTLSGQAVGWVGHGQLARRPASRCVLIDRPLSIMFVVQAAGGITSDQHGSRLSGALDLDVTMVSQSSLIAMSAPGAPSSTSFVPTCAVPTRPVRTGRHGERPGRQRCSRPRCQPRSDRARRRNSQCGRSDPLAPTTCLVFQDLLVVAVESADPGSDLQ